MLVIPRLATRNEKASIDGASDAGLGVFCVFDGHNGAEAAAMLEEIFPDILRNALRQLAGGDTPSKLARQSSFDPAEGDWGLRQRLVRAALGAAFVQADKDTRVLKKGGATATVLVVDEVPAGWLVTVANVGDSHAFLYTPKEAAAPVISREPLGFDASAPAGPARAASVRSLDSGSSMAALGGDSRRSSGSGGSSRSRSGQSKSGVFGSSRRSQSVHCLTQEHRAETNAAEVARIEGSGTGATIRRHKIGIMEVGPLRVWPGGLALTRTIGDHDVGPAVIAEPDFSHAFVSAETGGRVVMASDGYWDVVTRAKLSRDVKEAAPDVAARKLVEVALGEYTMKLSRRGREPGREYTPGLIVEDDTSILVLDFMPNVSRTADGEYLAPLASRTRSARR